MREVKVVQTSAGKRWKVRFRLAGADTSETFTREADAVMFRDILGNGKGGRLEEAMRWLRARQDSATSPTITFGEWFEVYVNQLTAVTPRTRADYRSIHRRYLSHLDALPLSMITRTQVTTLVNEMDTDGRAPKTIRQTIHLLSTCLTLAIDEGKIATNPCKRVRLPERSIDGVQARFLTYEEADTLVDEIPEQYRPLVIFMLGTGMRWSEATAIQGRHVNLDAGTVRVERAWKRVPGVGFKIGVTKSRKANRTVNAATMALAAAQASMGSANDLVFTMANGDPIKHANFFTHVWKPACKRSGIVPPPRIHDMRHTHASWLLSAGITLEAVQDQLGHESIETTRKVYAHLIPAVGVAVGKAASAALDHALVRQAAKQVLPLAAPQVIESRADDVEAHV